MDDALISSLEAIAPDTVLLDLGSPEALPFAARLVRARPSTRILGFGIDEAPLQVIACAEAGLHGCSEPRFDCRPRERRPSHRTGRYCLFRRNGRQVVSPLAQFALRGTALSTKSSLTGRQRQILALINEGLSNKQIAQRLSLGPSTVKNHVHGLLSRLHVARRTEAIASIRQDFGLGVQKSFGNRRFKVEGTERKQGSSGRPESLGPAGTGRSFTTPGAPLASNLSRRGGGKRYWHSCS